MKQIDLSGQCGHHQDEAGGGGGHASVFYGILRKSLLGV